MATYFRVHPDKMNRDIWDDKSRLFDANLEEVEPDVVGGNDILICATPEEWDAILAGRK